jgi:transposase
MRQKSGPEGSAEKHVKDIRRKTRRKFSAEEKIRIVLEGLRGEYSIAAEVIPALDHCRQSRAPL